MTGLISVILPVYNVEKYLEDCLDSLLRQTYRNIELIIIDDGSTDGSGKICDAFAVRDERIRVFHKRNEGVSAARNKGIEEACGKWIYFCDSDDTVSEDCIRLLASNVSGDIDLVEAGFNEIISENDVRASNFTDKTVSMDAEEYIGLIYEPSSSLANFYHGFPVTKLFNKSIINESHLLFNQDIHFKEDSLFIIQYCCCMTGKAVITNGIVYNYYHRPNSATSKHYAFGPLTIDRIKSVALTYQAISKRFPQKKIAELAKKDVVKAYFFARSIAQRNGEQNNKLLADGYDIAVGIAGKETIRREHCKMIVRWMLHYLNPLAYCRYIKRHISK
jgi:glycosyltransferase involved in cell wall biosynthesis